MKITIAVPTYNGGDVWLQAASNINKNVKKAKNVDVIIIDSGSNDDTVSIAKKYGFSTIIIPSSKFNHGGTRNLAVEKSDADIVIFLTQDAIPTDDFINIIVNKFNDPAVAAAYGRQLPHKNANPLAIHARGFNYKSESYICSFSDKEEMGLKTVFMSNSFSAYRVDVFKELGGFPANTILCEDMYFTAKAVTAGYKIAYASNASVYHSHNYNAIDEFKRYFDIGVFHHDEPWIRKSFGGAGGEGKNFIISELKYLLKKSPLWIPLACINNFAKIVGYKLGQNYTKLSPKWRRKLSMHKRYWDNVSN